MVFELRKKFVMIAMSSVTVVVLLILGFINFFTFRQMDQSCRERMELLIENEGKLPMPMKNDKNDKMGSMELFAKEHLEKKEDPEKHFELNSEAEDPYMTRYFSVTLLDDGTIIRTDMDNTVSVSEEDAAGIAQNLQKAGKTAGYLGNYQYQAVERANGRQYIFLNCGRELESCRTFLLISLIIGVIGLGSVFFLLLFFSKKAIRPLAESYEKQKRFITDASHEIKTPLTIIDANTEVLEMIYGESEWTESTRNQVRRLTSLTKKLVMLSRMEEEMKLEKQEFSLSEAVEETAESFDSVAKTNQKQLVCRIEPELRYDGNEESIRQMLSLLLDNAVKYASENSEILVCLQKQGKHVLLTVENEADDLKAGKYDVLFDRFYRPDISRNSSTGGYGIGLSVVRSTVLAHKGKITAVSEDGKTLKFKIIL